MTSPRCVECWQCPVCLLQGQTGEGLERTTSLAAHMRVVHPGAGPVCNVDEEGGEGT